MVKIPTWIYILVAAALMALPITWLAFTLFAASPGLTQP